MPGDGTPALPLRLGRLLAGLALLALAATAEAQAPVRAALATPHPEASAAGRSVLEQGGNAFDAAVAVAASLAVIEPYGSGLGGGGFFLLREDQGDAPARYRFLDARERAPLAAHAELYVRDGRARPELSRDGALAAAIPGLPAALVGLAARHGRLPLRDSLAPAIRQAREGFSVDRLYRQRAEFRLSALRDDPESARLFLADGEVPAEGHRVRQPELAKTLERLAERGHDGFYAGPVAERLVTGVRAAGGIWSAEDLARYRVVEREPLRFALAEGRELIGAPPPSAGGIALAQSLGMLERLPWRAADRVQRAHYVVEASRRAFRDRGLLGDPDFVANPVERLLAPAYLRELAAGIDPQRATPSSSLKPAPAWREGEHTSHFAVLDAEGHAVAATLSINLPFGAAFTVPGTGVLLNDEMDDFAADPQGSNAYRLTASPANAVAAGKRPLSSMSPSFIESADDLAAFGTPGGSRIPGMVLLAVLDYLDGQPVRRWPSVPRYHHQYLPDVIEHEPGAFDAAEIAELQRRGHPLKEREPYGNQQVLHWDKRSGAVEAASDPRGLGRPDYLPARR